MQIAKELCFKSHPAHWRDALMWFSFSLVGGLFPILATTFALLLLSQAIHFRTFTENGEFALYSAAFLSGNLYIVIREFKYKTFPSRVPLVLVLFVLLLVSTLLFAYVTLLRLVGAAGIPQVLQLLNQDVVSQVSWILLPLTFVVSICIMVAENARTDPDFVTARKKQIDDLNKRFDQLEG